VTLGERLDALYRAREILSSAKVEALTNAWYAGRLYDGNFYAAIETWRWVANAYDHLHRAIRKESGLEERANPFYPEHIVVRKLTDAERDKPEVMI